MLKGRWWHLWVLCAVFLCSSTVAGSTVIDDPPQVSLAHQQGTIVAGEFELNGTYIDEELPTTITWEIHNGTSIVASGDLITSLQLLPVNQSSRDIWSFEVKLNFTSMEPCSCVINVEAIDASQQSFISQLIIFHYGDTSESVVDLMPRAIFTSANDVSKLTGTDSIEVFGRDDLGDTDIQWALTDNSVIAQSCALSWIDNPIVNWSNPLQSIPNSQHSHQISIDTTNYDDGSYSLLLRALTDNFEHSSVSACLTVGIDNQFPTAIISGSTSLNESADIVQFDGSSSSDGIWGREELIFLWVLDGDIDGPQVVSGRDLSSFTIDGSRPGNFSLSLTVVDEVGFTNTTTHLFSIENQAPIASLRVGGQPLSDGSEITLIDSPQWLIECRDSYDTPNDQDGLICTWFIDDEPKMTGWARQLEKPADLSRPHTLTLLVTDDDGANDSITVTFGVQGTPSDPSYAAHEDSSNFEIIAQKLVVLLSIVVVMFTMLYVIRKYTGHSAPIPKWKRD